MYKVYLAGPEVFARDAALLAEQHKALCRQFGFDPLHPIDQPTLTSALIYRTNIGLLKAAHAVVANLNPFRGAEVDTGTAFEVGYAIALGKPVVGYVHDTETLKDRVARIHGRLELDHDAWRDRDGNLVEDFGHCLNLMLSESCILVIGGLEDALKKLASLDK